MPTARTGRSTRSRYPEARPPPALPLPAQQRPYLVVTAAEEHEQLFAAVLEHEAFAQTHPAFEKPGAQLAHAQPTVSMRASESLKEVAEHEQMLNTLAAR